MMEQYSKEFDSVSFGDICTAADKRMDDLPESMRKNQCFNHLLGRCRFSPRNCFHDHVKGSTLNEEDVDTLVDLLKPGVDKLVEDGEPSPRKRPNHRRNGRGNGKFRGRGGR